MSVRDRIALLAAGAALAFAGAVAVACSIYNPSLLISASDGGADDAGGTNAADAESVDGAVDTCALTHVPSRPTTEDGVADLDFVVAGRHFRFLPHGTTSFTTPPAPVGFDLDNACTCPGPESCTPPPGTAHCDFDGGVDNSAGTIISQFAIIAPDKFADDALNADVNGGLGTIVLRIRSYNGGKNDKQITVVLYASNGVDGIQDGGKVPTPPKLDGTDVWTLDPGSLLGGTTVDGGPTCEGNDNVCVPFYADTEAFVADGVLVAHIDFPISVGSGDSMFTVKLADAVVTAPLVAETGGAFHVDDGQIAGRWNTTSFLSALGNMKDPFNKKQNLCGDAGTYANIKQLVCKGADVMTSPTADGTGQPCDALSIAMSFSAVRAHLGPIYGATPKPTTCGADWKDDCSSVK